MMEIPQPVENGLAGALPFAFLEFFYKTAVRIFVFKNQKNPKITLTLADDKGIIKGNKFLKSGRK